MRRFKGGYQVVQVWSRTQEEHEAALALYKKKGWTVTNQNMVIVKTSDVPYRSVVQRKLRHRG